MNVQPQVGGQLLQLEFVEGGAVKKGQVLAQIDPRTLQAQLDQAIAKRAQDETQLSTAQANLARSESPQYKQYVAQIDRITQKNTVAQWQASVAADDASIRDTKVQLGLHQRRFADRWRRRHPPGRPGQRGDHDLDHRDGHPGASDLRDLHPAPANTSTRCARRKRERRCKSPLLDASNKVVEGDGVLQVIDNQIDTSTGSFKLRAEFPNGNNQLCPGQYVNVRLQVSIDDKALVVPSAAVQRGPNGDYVWLVTDKRPASADEEQPPESKSHRSWFGQGRDHTGAGKPAQTGPVKYVKMQTVTLGNEAGDSDVIIRRA